MKILVTGGAGYIGSHTIIELYNAGHEAVVIDNFSNSSITALKRTEQITGIPVKLYEGSILDAEILDRIFDNEGIEAVIHFAGLKAVGESVEKPLAYYDNNVSGTTVLLDRMNSHGVKKIIFSSSATVYGDPESVPIDESFPLKATNPYGRTKIMIEDILRDLYSSDNSWNIIILRYFNPIGAHKSGLIGEDPNGIPNNLLPYVSQVAVDKLESIGVFGDDYPTKDGTGVRDYIHVMDLAAGHVSAIKKLADSPQVRTYNLGTGKGYSVLEIIGAFEKACGKKLPYRVTGRRPGDIAECYASPTLAQKELGWKAIREIEEMCADSYNWQVKNPQGYAE